MAKEWTRTQRQWARVGSAAALMVAGMVTVTTSRAVTFSTMSGAPVQMQPYVDEPGAPTVVVPLGTPQPFTGLDSSGGSGEISGGGTTSGSSEALTTMLATPWGSGAAQIAEAVGINSSTLAATCAIESGCNSSARNGSFVGAFQMGPAAFSDGLATALAANPSLASQVVTGPNGINDPTTNAIAAAGYMLKGANALEAAGISAPTFSQARGYFQLGPADGRNVALASSDATLGSVLQFTSAQTLAANGLNANMTVGQYQATFADKAGSAAGQAVKA